MLQEPFTANLELSVLKDTQREFVQTQLCRNVWNVANQESIWKDKCFRRKACYRNSPGALLSNAGTSLEIFTSIVRVLRTTEFSRLRQCASSHRLKSTELA